LARGRREEIEGGERKREEEKLLREYFEEYFGTHFHFGEVDFDFGSSFGKNGRKGKGKGKGNKLGIVEEILAELSMDLVVI